MRSVRLTRVLRELRLATGRTLAMVAAVAVGPIAVGTARFTASGTRGSAHRDHADRHTVTPCSGPP